jgi:hypothetical protein
VTQQNTSNGVSSASEGYIFSPVVFILALAVLAEEGQNLVADFLYNFSM